MRHGLTRKRRICAVAFLVILIMQGALGQGVSSQRLSQMDSVIEEEIANKKLPGAVVVVGRKGRVVWRKAYGARALEPTREAMILDTIFDVASLTKVVATATSIMILVERGKLRLSDPISLYIPELKGEGRDRITIEQLLTHISGYAPDFDLRERWTGYDEAIKRLIKEPLRNPPGTRFTYSDIGFIALGEVVASTGAVLVLMHTRGRSDDMYRRAVYTDVVAEVSRELEAAMTRADAAGVRREAIVLDPGIGFAKRAEHSFAVLACLAVVTAPFTLIAGIAASGVVLIAVAITDTVEAGAPVRSRAA